MKVGSTVKNLKQAFNDPLEAIGGQAVKPMAEEAFRQMGLSGFGSRRNLSSREQELAKEDLDRARKEKEISEMNQKSESETKNRIAEIKNQYREFRTQVMREDKKTLEEVSELQEEVVKLAKSAGVNTKVHLEQNRTKASKLDIKLLTQIVRTMRLKAEESKSAQELVSTRSSAKRTSGMLAWVSGKQMKVHEQGTLSLQG